MYTLPQHPILGIACLQNPSGDKYQGKGRRRAVKESFIDAGLKGWKLRYAIC